jgi:hypothetical protein
VDDRRFDDLARALAGGSAWPQRRASRRGFAGGLAALAAVALGHGREAARAACPPDQVQRRSGCVCKTTGRPPDPDTGYCPCANGLTRCGGACVDLGREAAHCGSCANACPPPTPGTCEGKAVCRDGVCGFRASPAGTVCRPAAGPCDVAEVCDGRSHACPPDRFAGLETVCRPAAIACDAAEVCTGGSAACPPDLSQPDGTPCDADGDGCTVGDACQGGVCVSGRPLDCPTCQACSGGACRAIASDTRCGTVCCNGACCAAGLSCVDNACRAACLETQAACDPTDNRCCNGLCQDVVGCGGQGSPQCCFGGASRCFDRCDCCSPDVCVGGVCCRDQVGASCDGEQDLCCAGLRCLNGSCQPDTCLSTGDTCDQASNTCCQDEPTTCAFNPKCGGLTLPRCCHPAAGSCIFDCDCCGANTCNRGFCCVATGDACQAGDFCCDGGACQEGVCRSTCPLGGTPCGSACCGQNEHCIDGVCDCLDLQATCDPSNNLCCQTEPTMCLEEGPVFDHFSERCCRPQGGTCTVDRDCCNNSYNQVGRGPCGGGLCGGYQAGCNDHDDCIHGNCFGYCTLRGGDPNLCTSTEECGDDGGICYLKYCGRGLPVCPGGQVRCAQDLCCPLAADGRDPCDCRAGGICTCRP